MGTTTSDAFAALDNLKRSTQNYPEGKVYTLFKDQPELLAKVAAAYLRGASKAQIAEVLNGLLDGESVSDKAVETYIKDHVAT